MVAPRKSRKVFCTVICVPTNEEISGTPGNLNNRLNNRPSELLPWADPTIARLVTRLQDEVRFERRKTKLQNRISKSCRADLEPPWPSSDTEVDGTDESRWSLWE